jgi:hypothetical protein
MIDISIPVHSATRSHAAKRDSILEAAANVFCREGFAGTVVDPYGQKKAGFTVDGKISRKEFGLMSNAVTE